VNKPPATATLRLPQHQLEAFARDAALAFGLPEPRAELLARLLVENDVRGVFSHGTQLLRRYHREFSESGLNPRADPHVAHETPNSVLMDGEDGLGYFPAYDGTLKAIEKAEQQGMAAMVSRNHGHFGAAGIYARLTLDRDLLTFVTSGMNFKAHPDRSVKLAAGASPMAFSAPALEEPALLFDFGTTHGMSGRNRSNPVIEEAGERLELLPFIMRSLGLGMVCQSWGGFLAGLSSHPDGHERTYRDASQGAMLFTFKISLFQDPTTFKREMDSYARRVRQMKPLPGTSAAHLPGGVEAEREVEYREHGIPIGEKHLERMQKVADELGITPPWQ
jgi:LDH2 family malate/lactate/ureidoglycolate dehydrogenase